MPASSRPRDDPRAGLPSSITICSSVNTFDVDQSSKDKPAQYGNALLSSMFFQMSREDNESISGAEKHRHDFDQKLTRLYLVVGNTRENSMKFEYAMGITIRYNAAEMK